jgi:CheY-like chemotaxis protein
VTLVLEGLGYRVLEADGGTQAMSLAEAHEGPIELLLSDVIMPGMTGPMLAEQMKRRYPDLRILYMSGYTDEVAGRHVPGEGGAYIQKPFGAEALAQKVREVLGS